MMRIPFSYGTNLPQAGNLSVAHWEGSGEIGVSGFKLALRQSDPGWRDNWRQHGDRFLKQTRKTGVPILFIVDELPDMLLNLSQQDAALLREFLAWFRAQRLNPAPAQRYHPLAGLAAQSIWQARLTRSDRWISSTTLKTIPLPPLTDDDIRVFVREMLSGRGVQFQEGAPQRLVSRLGRPIPLFMQMATQDLYRLWKRERREIVASDVDAIFEALIVGPGARTRLQHYYSRIRQYYTDLKRSIAYALLGQISMCESGLGRAALLRETDRLLMGSGIELPSL